MTSRHPPPPPTRFGLIPLQPKTASARSLARPPVAPPPTRFAVVPAQAKTKPPGPPPVSPAPPPTRFGAPPIQRKAGPAAPERRTLVIQRMEKTTIPSESGPAVLAGIFRITGAGPRVLKDGGDICKPADKYPLARERDALDYDLKDKQPVRYTLQEGRATIVLDEVDRRADISVNDVLRQNEETLMAQHGDAIATCTTITVNESARRHYAEAASGLPGDDGALIRYVADAAAAKSFSISDQGNLIVRIPVPAQSGWSIVARYNSSATSLWIFHYGPGG